MNPIDVALVLDTEKLLLSVEMRKVRSGHGICLMYGVPFQRLDLLLTNSLKAKLLQPNPPPKVHHKVITWTEHHPTDSEEMITASADGTVKIWRTLKMEE